MVASEATPFCKTGGLADVIGALPAALKQLGHEVAVVLPAYRVNKYPGPLREVYRSLRIYLGKGYDVNIYECLERGVPFYFVDSAELFDRAGIYNEHGQDYADNHMRYAVLCMAALNVSRHLFRAQILHCHDWQTGLLPVYLQQNFRGDPTFLGARVLFTIHNLGHQGWTPASARADLGLDPIVMSPNRMELHGQLNLMKAGLLYSNWLNTVSRGYAREIQTPEYGFGLDGLLRMRSDRLSGIVNGVDYSEWNPEDDPNIPTYYTVDDLSGKRECKRALLAELGLSTLDLERPVIGIVSRFAEQKGFDLMGQVFHELASLDASWAIIGSGEYRFESMFRAFAAAYPDKFGVRIGYDNGLAHRIEAGSDMFLMPSLYEPCGLNQIYSLRYGTLPIVRATGGLDDTIEEGTGFKFWDYAGWALLSAVQHALGVYSDQAKWRGMMKNAMQKDFSWQQSALEYIDLYSRMLAS